jgi:hypothetical protein
MAFEQAKIPGIPRVHFQQICDAVPIVRLVGDFVQ